MNDQSATASDAAQSFVPTVRSWPQYHTDAVLTTEQLADALSVSVRTVERSDLPSFQIGRCRRYHYGTVVEVLRRRSE